MELCIRRSLEINVDADSEFDIGEEVLTAFALLKVNNVTAVYSINLTTVATKNHRCNVQATAMAVGLGFLPMKLVLFY
jgi:hypothetical protein